MAREQKKLDIALMKECLDGNLKEAVALISKGADVKYKDVNGYSPLFMASSKGYAEVAEMLISNGAIVNDKSNYRYSPLYFASRYGHVEVVDILIKNGAIVNEDHKDHTAEFTPLFVASQYGHKKVVQLLLSKGATIDEETIDIAKDEGHTKIVEILEDWPRTMAIVALQENHTYNLPNMTYLTDLNEYLGKKGKDFGGKRRRTIKRKSNKRRRTNRRRNSRKSRK